MKIRIINGQGWYRNEVGEIFEVVSRVEDYEAYYVKVWDDEDNRWVTDDYFVSDGNYEIVEELKTHVIGGKTFVEVERGAEVGERVVDLDDGEILEITEIRGGVRYYGREDGEIIPIQDYEYRVLEAVDQAQKSAEDLIANLIRRVYSLEKQLRDTQGNVERQSIEIAKLEIQVESIEEDIRTLDERTQPEESSSETVTLPKWLVKELIKSNGGERR
jgi:hypothetical protein